MGDITIQGTSLMTKRETHSVNTELCIIWQKSDNDNDTEVYECLLTIEGNFSYLMNNTCYREYIK